MAMVGALAILAALRPRQQRQAGAKTTKTLPTSTGIVFLFHDQSLIDATTDALTLSGQGSKHLSDYEATLGVLESRFTRLRSTLSDPVITDIRLRSEVDPSLFLDIRKSERQTRLELNTDNDGQRQDVVQQWMKTTVDAEKSLMEDAITLSPQLIWQSDGDGQILWANNAYSDFVQMHAPEKTPFSKLSVSELPAQERILVKSGLDQSEHWFDVQTKVRTNGYLHFANAANALVSVDQERKDFVQALGKTFAQLSIGLAIFDKERRLVIFNPALLDMTGLPTDFLLPKPTIDMFLDRLREKGLMPEPKNYGSWRDQFTAVEAAAKSGTYSEHWALSDGQTFRVTGRPHPDGAFAFLFEDISAEISLTRRFRSDIETGQAVLDTLSDAIAVFSAAGTLIISNHAYSKLWSTNHELMLEHRELSSEMSVWQDRCVPSPMWTEMRGFIQQQGARKPWSDDAMLDDGRHLRCYANPISGGMTMVRFANAQPMRPVIQKITQTDRAIQTAKR